MGHMTQRSRAVLKHALAAVVVALGAISAQAQTLMSGDGRAALASLGAGGASPMPSTSSVDGITTIRAGGDRSASVAPPAALAPVLAQREPLAPNDFQRFVLETSGQALPLFGADLFERPNPYVPADNSPVSPDYRVGPDDELQVRAWGSVDVDVRAVVDRDGRIHIPRIGAISVAGIRSAQVEDVVRSAIGKYYKEFQVSVTMGQLRGITVYVVGQARQPGSYKLSSQSTLVSALFASGGPNQNGSMRRIQVKRAGKAITELDLYQFLSRGDKGDDIRLQDGDTIVIPPARAFVAIGGKVAVPAVYEMAQGGDTIGSLLALTGGLPVVADPKRAQLERLDPSRKPARSVEVFALDAAGLNKRVRPGDLLTVSSVVPEFGNTVSLRGNVAQSLRSPWREGMTVRDLIPSRGFLMSQASITRQNEAMLNDEARRRARSGQFDSTAKPASDKATGDTADTLAARIGKLVDEVNFEYAVVERVDTDRVSVKLIPFNLGKALDDAASPENLPLQPGDIVTVFSVNDVRVPQAKRQVFVRVEGEVHRPGIYQMAPGEGLPQLLERAGGLTPDAYLFGAEFYREDVRRNQAAALQQLVNRLETQVQGRLSSAAANVSGAEAAGVAQLRLQAETQAQKEALQRLRELKPTGRIMLGLQGVDARQAQLPPLKLESQDRLVIPSRPDFVYVLGSVNTESALIWREGQSVKDYLNQSGLTGGADLDEMFVIRADGSVISAQRTSWFSSLERTTVLPGDVIVLPEKTNRESAWSVFTRNAKDITQIIYQFSLGAAAIKTLRD
jgi:protein involved in polysaccharide export with SLBB domain